MANFISVGAPYRNAMLAKSLARNVYLSRSGSRRNFRLDQRQSIGTTSVPASGKVAGFAAGTSVPQKPILSSLPTPILLRSLLISAISSSPFLLGPLLRVLSFLSRQDGGFLFNVKRNPLLYWPLKWTFYKQFCAGETAEECQKTMEQMRRMGFSGTLLTYAKETVFDSKNGMEHGLGTKAGTAAIDSPAELCQSIEAWRKGTLETVAMLGDGDQLAIKLTGAGPLATKAFAAGELPPAQMMRALEDVCRASRERKARIVVDAESQHFQHGIAKTAMRLMQMYNTEGYALVFNTYQAYLKGTLHRLEKDLARAAEGGWTMGVKVVRGAYIASDQRSLIHDTKEETDDAYNTIAQGVLRQELGSVGGEDGGRPFPKTNLLLATHNRHSALTAYKTQQQRIGMGLPTVPVQFAQLHGMSDEVSFSLLRAGDAGEQVPKVLKCSTWGSLDECLAYLTRRATENRDAVSRTHDEYSALKKELRRRLW